MPAGRLFEFVVKNNIDHEVIEIDGNASTYDVGVLENDLHCERIAPTVVRIDKNYFNAIFSANHVIDIDQLRKNPGRESAVQMDSAEEAASCEHHFIIEDRLLRQNTAFTVRLGDTGKLLKIDCNDFARVAQPQTVHMPAAPVYKAKLGYLAPKAEQNSLPQFESCFLGVSLENSNFIRPKLLSMIEWISNRFKNCTVLVGDSIHRITLAANGMPTEMALQQAMKLGDEFIEREANCLAAFSDRCNFTFTRCSDAQRQARYSQLHAELNELFQSSEAFNTSVLEFAQSYHQKLRDTLSEVQWQIRMTSSKDYFLEEFAVMACLQEQGWPVLVYPGSFSTLVDIVEGRIDTAPPSLKALKLACLHIKKR